VALARTARGVYDVGAFSGIDALAPRTRPACASSVSPFKPSSGFGRRVETDHQHWFDDEGAVELHRGADRFAHARHRAVLFVRPSRVDLDPVCEAAGRFPSLVVQSA
jgi:hypothetical protein